MQGRSLRFDSQRDFFTTTVLSVLLQSPDAQVIEATTIERAAELAVWHLNEIVQLAGTASMGAKTPAVTRG